MSQSSLRFVFVYGTLRRGEQRDINLLRPAPDWVGTGTVPGTLYDLGAYPGIVVGSDRCADVVTGEVYAICATLERLLDEIEEVWPQQAGEYTKREVLVRMAGSLVSAIGQSHERLCCLVYEVLPECTEGKPRIISGDWVQHRANSAS